MNKTEAKGTVEETKGKVKKEIGKATGSKKLQASGSSEELSGKVKKTAGRSVRRLGDVLSNL